MDDLQQQSELPLSESTTVPSHTTAHEASNSQTKDQDILRARLQVIKDKHFDIMNTLHESLTARLTQLQRLMNYRDLLDSMSPYLLVPWTEMPQEFDLKMMEEFEENIASILSLEKF
ncbi:hypothetical protein MPTK1_8g07560 [Marchantia polymorpha subsp. ruderalis]|uniref:Uncharacterized protein n=1 Tax=Marchantia polymorpha TaxID=3197 RepID=A0A2R6XI71_MARPO|nr:hypothetical protein MARPO_0013s0037 [Marchantia polymorpha]PTQ45801.1 hypothetical protein MARPO_0013s0037 [Marchantia polymorpha]BBN19045.1 hypothetical protein Mp_8g07560 [Marchantia polymorpha subsp. ruderalis]BBN19046.1 hypothetical protein Mp_8g07560 [Marchantia polymorpha subsp. ruderalis]|eukprot:PTQ45800.1 hypothetical protein MARPO_0013s0037 [Marchantia polymorpha]